MVIGDQHDLDPGTGTQSVVFRVPERLQPGAKPLLIELYNDHGVVVTSRKHEILIGGNEAPVISVHVPDDAILVPGQLVELSVRDRYFPITRVEVYLDDVLISEGGSPESRNFATAVPMPSDQQRTSVVLRVEAENQAGQSDSLSKELSVVPFPDGPSIELSLSTGQLWSPGETLRVSTRGRVVRVSAYLNDRLIDTRTGDPDNWGIQNFEFVLEDSLVPDTYELRIEAEDGLGNPPSKKTVQVDVPEEPLELSSTLENDVVLEPGSSFTVFSRTGRSGGRLTVRLGESMLVQREVAVGLDETHIELPSDLAAGAYRLNYSIDNGLGRPRSREVGVWVSGSEIDVAFSFAAGGELPRGGRIVATVKDDIFDIKRDTLAVEIDDVPLTPTINAVKGGYEASLDLPPSLDFGEHTLRVSARNAVGDAAYSSRKFWLVRDLGVNFTDSGPVILEAGSEVEVITQGPAKEVALHVGNSLYDSLQLEGGPGLQRARFTVPDRPGVHVFSVQARDHNDNSAIDTLVVLIPGSKPHMSIGVKDGVRLKLGDTVGVTVEDEYHDIDEIEVLIDGVRRAYYRPLNTSEFSFDVVVPVQEIRTHNIQVRARNVANVPAEVEVDYEYVTAQSSEPGVMFNFLGRSEERRVGKECRSRRWRGE